MQPAADHDSTARSGSPKLGPEKNGGPKLYCVSGHVKKPGIYEASMNTTLKELIFDHAGGIRDGHQLKAVIPGGSSVPILLPDQLDIPASFDDVQKAGSMLGSAGIIVMDETTCMVWAAMNLMHFYKHESCGKCTPCREGGDWLHKILSKIERGDGEMRDLDLLTSVSNNIAGKTLCAFGDAEATPPLTTLKHLPRRVRGAHPRRALHRAGRLARARRTGGGALTMMSAILNPTIIAHLVLIFIIFNCLVLSAAFMVWMERKVCAYIQDRDGPNRVGLEGSLQPFADVIKLLFKEDLRPRPLTRRCSSSRRVISTATAFAAFSVVPFGTETTLFGLLDEPLRLEVTDVNVAVLVIFAITSMGIYGIVLAGWSSNSKYSLLGGLRSSAQMISYELSYGLALAAVVMLAGSLSLREIVMNQSGYWWHVIPQLVHLPAAARLPHLHDRRRRRDQPRAVRLPGSGAGARRRLSHRVQQHELRAVLPRGVHQHGDRVGGGDEPVPGRLARPVPARRGSAGSGSCSRSCSCCSSTCGCAGRCRATATTS